MYIHVNFICITDRDIVLISHSKENKTEKNTRLTCKLTHALDLVIRPGSHSMVDYIYKNEILLD